MVRERIVEKRKYRGKSVNNVVKSGYSGEEPKGLSNFAKI